MILFLFGTWGCGKSYVGKLIEEHCGIPHLEADLFFDDEMRQAISNFTYQDLNLDPFFGRVMGEMQSYQRRATHFTVSYAIYHERYRKMIYDHFYPNIHFIWVRVPKQAVQKTYLQIRAEQGGLITPVQLRHMQKYWQAPQLPHEILENDQSLEENLRILLNKTGICLDSWIDSD